MTAFLLAGALSLLWLGVHLFVGGKEVAVPLRASADVPAPARDTAYLCWHYTSIAIGAMAVLFGLSTLTGVAAYAEIGTALAAAFAALGIAMVPRIGQTFRVMPQGWLFVPIAALGGWGLWG